MRHQLSVEERERLRLAVIAYWNKPLNKEARARRIERRRGADGKFTTRSESKFGKRKGAE